MDGAEMRCSFNRPEARIDSVSVGLSRTGALTPSACRLRPTDECRTPFEHEDKIDV